MATNCKCLYYLCLPGKKHRVQDAGKAWVRDNVFYPKQLFTQFRIETTRCVGCIKERKA